MSDIMYQYTFPETGDELKDLLGKLLQLYNGGGTVPSTPGSAATNAGSNNRATGQQTSTGSAAQLVGARTTRRGVLVSNNDSSAVIAVGSAGVTFATGDLIQPGNSKVFTCTAALFVIDNNSAHATVSFTDEYD